MRKFDTKVQLLKYKVLREVARIAFDEGEFSLANNFNDIAKTVTSDKATMRCCIYKERAIVAERIKLACGGNRANPNIIEVIDIACDECPASGYQVSHDCVAVSHTAVRVPAAREPFPLTKIRKRILTKQSA